MYHCLLFDLDNTLIDRDAAVRAFYTDRLNSFSPSQIDRLEELLRRDRSGYGDRTEFLNWYQKHFAPEASHQELQIEMRFGIVTRIRTFPGVKKMLKNLGKDHIVGLLSNGSGPGQRQKLRDAGLTGCFEPENIFISGEMLHSKPDKLVFRTVLKTLGVTPASTLMIGDDVVNDIAGAESLGIDACWISHGRPFTGNVAPTHTIEKPTQLPEILAL
jgi:putative hydrolase of the HAD superfamily